MPAALAQTEADDLIVRRLRIMFWLVGTALATWQAYTYRHWVNGDAISYLDMSDAVVQLDLGRLVNGAWSSLYPALIGLVFAVVRPEPAWEFPLLHAVNLLCFMLAMAALEFLLQPLLRRREPESNAEWRPLPQWAAYALAQAAFQWSALGLLTLMKPTPDMLMAAVLFLAVGLAMRVGPLRDGAGIYALLGLVVGIGYYAKTIMLPLGIILVAASALLAPDLRRGLRGALIAASLFAVVIAPLVAGISRKAGALSYGAAGRITHLIYIERVNPALGRVGSARGAFRHPPARIFENPPVLAFERPIRASYHYWFDPSYWIDGVQSTFDLRRDARSFARNVGMYLQLATRIAGLILPMLMLVAWSGPRAARATARRAWPLWLVSSMALGAYATVHVEERYIGAFASLFVIGLATGARTRMASPRWIVPAIVALGILNSAIDTAMQIRRESANQENIRHNSIRDEEAAMALRACGLRPGDRVARINPFVSDGWARLARVQIIAEVARGHTEEFWNAPPERQDAVLHALANVGAKAVVGYVYPRREPIPEGWTRLGSTDYLVRNLLVTDGASGCANESRG